MAHSEPLRQALEKRGYQVHWQGVGKPIKVSRGGQTFEISDYETRGGTAYISPSVLQQFAAPAKPVSPPRPEDKPVRPTLEEHGFEVGYDPKTKQVTAMHPVTGYTHTWTPAHGVEGSYYASPEELERIRDYVTPSYEKVPQQIQADLVAYQQQVTDSWNKYYAYQQKMLDGYMQQMNSYVQRWQEAGLVALQHYQYEYGQALGQLQKLMTPDPNVPESVKLALDMVKKKSEENIRRIDEEMNRRGVYQSTIARDRLLDATANMEDNQRAILAQWLDQQHKQMLEATLRYATTQERYAQGLANLYGQVYQTPIEMGMGVLRDATQWQQGLAAQGLQLHQQLANQGLEVSVGLRKWIGEREDAARQSKAEREAAQAKAEMDYQRWLADMGLKEATLAEQIRHHQAMEARPVSGGGGAGYPPQWWFQWQQGLLDAEEEEKMRKMILDKARFLGTDELTASIILQLERDYEGYPDAALAQLNYMKTDPTGAYTGADFKTVERVLASWRPSGTVPKTGWPQIVPPSDHKDIRKRLQQAGVNLPYYP